MANLREKHFKTAVITVFNDIQQNMLKINEQIWNLNRGIETIKKNQFKILQLKSKWNKNVWIGLKDEV